MKKIYALLVAVLMTTATFAQNKLNIVIFSEDGEPFFAFVNGIKQNQTAETNIRITDLTSESFHFRIVFANSGNQPLTKDQYLPFGSEYTFKIKKGKNGLKLAPFGQVALTESTSTAPSYAYTTTENTGTQNNAANSINTNTNGTTTNTNVNTNGNNTTTGTHVQTSETITTTTTTTNGTGNTNGTSGSENVGINMNVGANGMNFNMSVNGTGTTNGTTTTNTTVNGTGTNNTTNNAASNISTNGTTTTTYSTTTTTTSSSSTGTGTTNTTDGGMNYDNNSNTTTNMTNNNTSSTVCYYPATDADFTKMKTSIESKTYQDVMMSTAKQATKNNCLNTTQIGEIMKLFMMDEDKLAYAKYAYDYCTEKQNYYQLADVLTYSSTQEEFNAWLEKK